MSERETDVIVVGAGFAGLSAARALMDSGIDCLVLEARDRVGGRVLNEPIGDGKVVEVGGQWVGPTQTRLLALAREMGVDTFPTYNTGSNQFELGGRIHKYRGTIPRINPLVGLDIAQAQARIDRMARQVPLEAPWKAAKWDGQTFWTWLRRNTRTRGARELLQLACEAVWAAHPADVSLLHILFYTHSAGGFDALVGTEGGAQQDRFVGGSQLVAERLAERLGERVVLDTPVRRIEHGDGTVRIDGWQARRVIVTLPPALAGRIVYDPPLHGHRDQLTQRMPMGTVAKCMAVYPEPFWRAEGLSGQATSATGPVKVIFDNSPPDGSPGVLLGFLEGRQARELGRAPAEERRQAVIDGFVRFFGSRAAKPERYIEKLWAEEEFTRGCYVGYFPPNAWTDFGPALREPIGPIHWAGTETATVWNGYMDGAIESGERAAREVLTSLAAQPVSVDSAV